MPFRRLLGGVLGLPQEEESCPPGGPELRPLAVPASTSDDKTLRAGGGLMAIRASTDRDRESCQPAKSNPVASRLGRCLLEFGFPAGRGQRERLERVAHRKLIDRLE